MKKILLAISGFICCTFLSFGQVRSNFSSQAHQNMVNQILCNSDGSRNFYTIGEDGFVISWDEDYEGEHFQISDVGIKIIAACPGTNLIAVYETDGGTVNKISIWDTSSWKRRKQFKYKDSITSIAFSAKGTYLIVGTASVEGAIFYRTSTWDKVKKLKNSTGIVNLIQTSDSEKTCVFYSPSGSISYYNLQTGELKMKYSVVQGLSQTVLFNENKFLGGVKDNDLIIINAYTGKNIASVTAKNPVILSTKNDSDLFYFEYDERNLYEIKKLENISNERFTSAKTVKSLRGPRGSAAINVGTKDYEYFYFGSKVGSLYKSEVEENSSTENIAEFTENIYEKITDMTASNNVFYFLTGSKILSSAYTSGIVEDIAENENSQTNLICIDENNFVLWSQNSRSPVTLFNKENKTLKTLFEPKTSVQTLHLCSVKGNQYLVDVESSSTVNIFDFAKETLSKVYTGSGIQDAVLVNSGEVYVAKSASVNPQVPLLRVNPETYETVPINIAGNICYALSTDGEIIYGINLISDGDDSTTFTFSYNTKTSTYKNILRFVDEDSKAFTYLKGDNLFTNIGKNKLYCYNLKTKKNMSYNRSASMPKKCFEENSSVVILNDDGSLSWCKTNNSQIQYDWYLKTDGNWYEF